MTHTPISEKRIQLDRLVSRLQEMQEEAWSAGCSTSQMFPHFQNMCARRRSLESELAQMEGK